MTSVSLIFPTDDVSIVNYPIDRNAQIYGTSVIDASNHRHFFFFTKNKMSSDNEVGVIYCRKGDSFDTMESKCQWKETKKQTTFDKKGKLTKVITNKTIDLPNGQNLCDCEYCEGDTSEICNICLVNQCKACGYAHKMRCKNCFKICLMGSEGWCDDPIFTKLRMPRTMKCSFFCKNCIEFVSQSCCLCNKQLIFGPRVVSNGYSVCIICVTIIPHTCWCCKNPVRVDQMTIKNGKAWCLECVNKSKSPKF